MKDYRPDIRDVCKDSMRLYEDVMREMASEMDPTKYFILMRKAEGLKC